MSKTPEEVKQEILEEFDKDTACFDIASSCRPEISRLISTALDRYGEAVREDERDKLHSMYKPAGFDELSADVYHRFGYNLAIDEMLEFLSPKKK